MTSVTKLGGGLEGDRDGGAASRDALERNGPSPALREALRDRQAEPRPARGGRKRGLEDARERVGRNTTAVVLDGQPLAALGQALSADENGKSAATEAWERYCQVLLCANEFIYVD